MSHDTFIHSLFCPPIIIPAKYTEMFTGADNQCIGSGVLVGNTDCLICSIAIDREMEVLTTDKDFAHMSNVIPIKLHQTSEQDEEADAG